MILIISNVLNYASSHVRVCGSSIEFIYIHIHTHTYIHTHTHTHTSLAMSVLKWKWALIDLVVVMFHILATCFGQQ